MNEAYSKYVEFICNEADDEIGKKRTRIDRTTCDRQKKRDPAQSPISAWLRREIPLSSSIFLDS